MRTITSRRTYLAKTDCECCANLLGLRHSCEGRNLICCHCSEGRNLTGLIENKTRHQAKIYLSLSFAKGQRSHQQI